MSDGLKTLLSAEELSEGMIRKKDSAMPRFTPPPAPNPEPFVSKELKTKASLYTERNVLYGDNYKHFGPSVKALFPEGVELRTADDWARMGVLVQIISKVTRYAGMFSRGGHDDSLDDITVYAMMLKELDTEARKRASGQGELLP